MIQHLTELAVQHATQYEMLEHPVAIRVGSNGGVNHHFADFCFVGVVGGAYVDGCGNIFEERGAV